LSLTRLSTPVTATPKVTADSETESFLISTGNRKFAGRKRHRPALRLRKQHREPVGGAAPLLDCDAGHGGCAQQGPRPAELL